MPKPRKARFSKKYTRTDYDIRYSLKPIDFIDTTYEIIDESTLAKDQKAKTDTPECKAKKPVRSAETLFGDQLRQGRVAQRIAELGRQKGFDLIDYSITDHQVQRFEIQLHMPLQIRSSNFGNRPIRKINLSWNDRDVLSTTIQLQGKDGYYALKPKRDARKTPEQFLISMFNWLTFQRLVPDRLNIFPSQRKFELTKFVPYDSMKEV